MEVGNRFSNRSTNEENEEKSLAPSDVRLPTAMEVLAAAKAAGLEISLDGGDLLVEFDSEPPSALVDAIRAHKPAIMAHLRAAPLGSSGALLHRLGVEVVLIEDEATAEREISALLAETPVIGLDVETAPRPEHLADPGAALNPLKAEVRLLQLASETKALVIDLRKVSLCSPALAPVWRQTLVGHNLSFDAKMLITNGISLDGATIVDTILLAGLFLRGNPDRNHEGTRRPSLAMAALEAMDIELPKEMQRSDWSGETLSDEQIAYAALDAVIARCLFTHFQPDLERQHLATDGLKLSERLSRAVLPVARMELNGVRLDASKLAKLDAVWRVRAAALREEFCALSGVSNPASAKQVADWLDDGLQKLGLASVWPRTQSNAFSTQAKHLKRLIGLLPGVETFLELSRVQQLFSTFGQSLIERVGPDGLLHANFQLAGAKSGRFTSSKPNLQNIPRAEEIRLLFIADPGSMMACADYSQLELRVMAAISGDEVMTHAYREGRDLHATTAAGMLGIDSEEFDKANPIHADARKKAKAINFGIIYGSGAGGIQEFARDAYEVDFTIEEANDLIRRFKRTYRGVARWMDRQTERAERLGNVETVGGRRYRFSWERHGWFSRTLALNLPIQGTAAEIAVEAVTRIDARLRRDLPDGKLVLQVHDEFVLEVPEERTELAKAILVEEMTVAFSALLPEAPTLGLVDAHAGPNWAAAKG